MVKKYIENLNELGRLPKLIIQSHPRGYKGIVVEGPREGGKSVFCLKATRQVYQFKFGISRDDAWEMILGVGNYRKEKPHIIFSFDDIRELFKIINTIDWDDPSSIPRWMNNNTHLCKIWDDAGMHAGKYKYQSEAKMVDFLQGHMDVIRFVLTGFFINSPELSNLLRILRDYHDHYVVDIRGRLEGGSKHDRIGFIQKWKKNKRGVWMLKASPPHMPFSRWLGNVKKYSLKEQWVYDIYELMKAKAIKDKTDKWERMAELAKQSEPDKDPFEAIGVPEKYKKLILEE